VSSPGSPILRHGIDLVDLAEFRRVFDRHAAFEERVFSDGERDYCRTRPDPTTHFAARFAAKEATLKALGMGMGAVGIDARLKDIEVKREGGSPEIVLHGRMARAADRHSVGTTVLSLSHSGGAAIASVIMMSFQPDDAGGERV
jgi:holo-[acyl-carrier protein] synthase